MQSTPAHVEKCIGIREIYEDIYLMDAARQKCDMSKIVCNREMLQFGHLFVMRRSVTCNDLLC